jgi:hypothetical protein
MFKHLFALAAVAALSLPAHAVVVTQWNFNSATPDTSPSTGTTAPAVGTGTASLVGGATSPSFNSGTGSSDLAADNSGWQTTTYAAQGTGDKTRGVQFLVSTVGFKDVMFSYDLRHSNTSANTEVVQYTVDGSTWTDIASFTLNAGDTWANGRSVDLSGIDAADNNDSFGLRVVAGFGNATGYLASKPGNNYAGTGTWRFDMVTVAAAPVPEPSTYALMAAGLAAVGFLARRRRA